MTTAQNSPRTFEEFWTSYLRAHRHRETRVMHMAGTVAAAACVAGFAKTGRPAWLAAALVAGYGPAWAAHAVLEKNTPKTLANPLWSLRADIRMLASALTGTLDKELRDAGVSAEGPMSAGSL